MVQIESFSGGMEGVTVHLLPPLGEREFMGTLPTDGMTWFDVEGPILPGEYRLVAESPDGLTVASRPFFLRGSGVRWNITSNAVVPIGWATTAD